MLKVENRESAHLKSRVKDLSVVPNIVSYTALLAAITPIAKIGPSRATGLYEPVLIRDVDSLIANFGDPRIDPEKYIDLYTIMRMVSNGATVYLTKVNSGSAGVYNIDLSLGTNVTERKSGFTSSDQMMWTLSNVTDEVEVLALFDHNTSDDTDTLIQLSKAKNVALLGTELQITLDKPLSSGHTLQAIVAPVENIPMSITAHSSSSEDLKIALSKKTSNPTSLGIEYLKAEIKKGGSTITETKIKLEPTTTNQSIINVLNANLGPYFTFELNDPSTADACIVKENGKNSIAKQVIGLSDGDIDNKYIVTLSESNFEVTLNDYKDALNQYKARKYTGCLMADLVAPLSYSDGFGVPSADDRRVLHYIIHEIAVERKDVTVIFSTPMQSNADSNTLFTVNDVCDWTASQGSNYNELWEYAHTKTTDYSEQGFYMEMYYSWLYMQCAWVDDGKVKSKTVMVAPSCFVVNNILTSYRERGVYFPVAGDQYGTLQDEVVPVYNPATKAERDQLVQYRINPIYDTGTRGVHIYGNETLNAGYTDLNAAHIARTLVYLRSTIDEYTERLKFSINSLILWDTWKNYVTNYVLEPLRSAGALNSYSVAMGTDTTSPEEIANRTIRGEISVSFFQSAEIFDLTYTVYSSATTVEAAQAAGY